MHWLKKLALFAVRSLAKVWVLSIVSVIIVAFLAAYSISKSCPIEVQIHPGGVTIKATPPVR